MRAASPTTSPAAVAAITFGAMAAGAVPLYAISALGPVLVDQLEVSRVAVGGLSSLVFASAAVGSVFLGRMADRRGARRTLAAAMTGGVMLTLAALGLRGYGSLLVWAVVAGPFLAVGNPVTNRLIAGLVAEGRRGVVVGVKQSGVQASAVLAGAVVPSVGLRFGWQAALAVGVVVPLSVLISLPALTSDPSRRTARGGAAPAPGSVAGSSGDRASLGRRVPVSRGVRLLAVYAALMGAGVSCINVFAPLFVVEQGIVGPVGAGGLVSVVGGAGVIARVALSHRAERDGAFARWLGILAVGAIAGIAVLVAAPTVGSGVVLAALAALVLGTTAVGWNAVAMLFLISGTRDEPGVATGWMLRGFYVGTAAGPTLFGLVADGPLGYLGGWGAVVGVFVAAIGVVRAFAHAAPTSTARTDGRAT